MICVVCILHGGCSVPGWLAQVSRVGRLYLTVNDPGQHAYGELPPGSLVTHNPVPKGFAHNVNAALRRAFVDERQETACVVNFDLEMAGCTLDTLVTALDERPEVGAVGAVLRGQDGAPTFSAGTWPTPLKEFLRASGLRSRALIDLQRLLLRHTRRWSARNSMLGREWRVLSVDEYLPWTCLAIRRRAWEDVGLLDERFPLYAEDIDWGLRCHQSDWKLALQDCGPVVHLERATRGRRSDSLYELSHRELHRKWAWHSSLRWQQRGLRVRRRWPLRTWTAPLDWSLLERLTVGEPTVAPNDA
ncbi:MAG: glycosyltransferase [Actinomycetota bacterium]|nr:glycosyltransferase [Actinomycetota bacterium]MDQ6948091.1 glycosyltransferase [Actinomycetota bacterium]